MQDIYLMPDGTYQAVTAGSAPPPGGMLVSGPSANGVSPSSPTSASSTSSTSSGIDPSQFGAAAASGTSPLGGNLRNVYIPVWRDAAHMTQTPFVSSGPGSANAVENSMGDKNGSANAVENAMNEAKYTSTPQMFKEADAYNEFATILTDPDKFKQWSTIAVQSGLLNPAQSMDAASLQRVWDQMVKFAVDIKQIKGIDMTPFEAAQMIGQNSGSAFLANQNFVRDHLTGTRIQNDQTIDEKTPSQTTLHDLLGRTPTQAELIAYNHGVQQTAAANPLNREIQTHYVQGQPDSQTVTYTGGYDQQAAEVQAANAASPAVAQNQAATTYYNALVNALRAAA